MTCRYLNLISQFSHALLCLSNKYIYYLTFFIVFIFSYSLAHAENVKQILILHSYHKGLGWTDGISQGVEKTFEGSKYRFEFFTEYMDTKRIFSDKYLTSYSLFLGEKYKNREFDIIICSDDHAFLFLNNHQEKLFPDTPVVFCGVNYFSNEFYSSKISFTGVVESFSIKDTIDAALFINPQLKRVYSVVDNSVSGEANIKLLKQVIPKYQGNLQFFTITDKDMDEVRSDVSHLPHNSIVLVLAFTSDKSGNTYSLEQSADLITEASNRQVFSFWDFHLNHGIIGGMITTGFSQGATAAELALKILNGQEARAIPVITESPNELIFDHNILRKFNISIKQLPPGSIVINQPHSFYEAYKKLIISTLIALAVLLSLVLSLSVNVIQRRRAEKELIKHRNHLEELVEERTIELRKTNSALSDSEERYRSLSGASFEGIVISENGIIIETNNTFSEMLGYPREELSGMSVIDFVALEEKKNVLNKLSSDYEKPYETLGAKKDGKTIPLEVHARIISYQGRRARVTAIRDLSERQKAQKLLQESEKRLLQAQKLARIGYYVLDLKTGYWTSSSVLDEIFGINKNFKRNSEGWEQIVHPEYKKEMKKYFHDYVLGKRKQFDKEYKIINLENQKECWVHGIGDFKYDENGNVLEMLGTIQDISERRQMEQDLRDSQENMASVLNNTRDGIVRLDKNFRYIFANPSMHRATGLSREQYIGKTNQELGMPEQLCVFWQEQYKNVFHNGEAITSEFNFVTAHRGERTLQSIISPEFNENNTVETIICIIRDISDLKQAEADKNATIAKLEKALAEVKTLRGFLPICARCKKIRDDKGYWNNIESYLQEHSEVSFSHGMCTECADELYGNEGWYKKMQEANVAQK